MAKKKIAVKKYKYEYHKLFNFNLLNKISIIRIKILKIYKKKHALEMLLFLDIYSRKLLV